MPPQQHQRLLDFGDNGFGFGAHVRDQISGVRHQVSTAELLIRTLEKYASDLLIPDQYSPPVPVRTTVPVSGTPAVGTPLASAPITE
jgi:hypothetical protein